jgi:hypothetical protein
MTFKSGSLAILAGLNNWEAVWNGGDIPKDWSIAMIHTHRILETMGHFLAR